MSEKDHEKQKLSANDQDKYSDSPLRQYSIYSSIIYKIMAIIAFGKKKKKKLNDYFELNNNLLTVFVGLSGLGLALYNTLKQLENLNKK